MKKLILTGIVGLTAAVLSTATPALAAITGVTMSFDDHSGVANALTSNTGTFTFSFDVSLGFTSDGLSPSQLKGLSYWLETETGAASHITLTSETYATITSQTDPSPNKVFNSAAGADSGFLASHDSVANPNTGSIDTGDLGGTFPPQNAGTFQVATLNFSVSGLTPGVYHLETTHLSPLVSVGSDTSFGTTAFPQAVYTITVVPEPATWSLLGLGGIGSFGLTWLRARRRS